MAIRGAGFKSFGSLGRSITPEHIELALPKNMPAGLMTAEHIKFLEELSDDFKYMGKRDAASFSQEGVCTRAESARSIVFVEVVEEDGSTILTLLSDCVSAGEDAIRVMHPRTGYTTLDLDSVLAVHEFNYGESNYTSYPYENVDVGASYTIPFNYPTLFTQCDPRWKNDMINTKTVCAVGCLMSSVAMTIYRHGNRFMARGSLQTSNPGTLNAFLRANGGYTGNLFIHGAISKICASGKTPGCSITYPSDGGHNSNDLSVATFQKYLRNKRSMVANVKNGGHYVLAIGWQSNDPDKILVRDPATSAEKVYSFRHDIVGWRIYNISGPGSVKGEQMSPESILREVNDEISTGIPSSLMELEYATDGYVHRVDLPVSKSAITRTAVAAAAEVDEDMSLILSRLSEGYYE